MITTEKLQELKNYLQNAKTIAIFGHEYIDGDCIGSMLSMNSLLKKMGKKVACFTPIAPSKTFQFVKDISEIKTEFDYKEYDLLLFVDFTPYGRISQFTSGYESYFDAHTKIIIDHHLDDRQWGNFEIKDTDASSNCEWIFEIASQLRPEYLDKDIATWLYLGLSTDTGNFFYEKDSERTMKNALGMLQLGADKYTIMYHIFRQKTLKSIQFMQLVLSRITVQNEILYSYYTDEECKNYGVDKEEAEYALPIIQSITGIKIYILFKKVEEKLGASLRSQGNTINCSMIAKQFNGGGHFNASGFKIPFTGDLQQQMQAVVSQIHNFL